ncbi:MAG: porin [Burkholderiales bacterium]
MKKSLLALTVLSAFTGAASAQSSVTVYGVVDLAMRNVHNNSGSITSQVNGALNSNRLGFKGTEDLGGGLSANFVLESDIFADTGQAGGNTTTPVPANQFWSRMSYVGLKSASLGEVRLGRDYNPVFFTVAGYDPFGYVGVGSISNFFTSTQVSAVFSAFGPATTSYSTLVRAGNSVAYYTPKTLGGFFASAMGALGEGGSTGASGNSKFWSLRAGYSAGPISVDGSYAETKNTNLAGQAFKEAAIGGSYDFGIVKLMAEYAQLKYVTAKSAVYMVSANGPAGEVGVWKVSYGRVNQSGTAPTALGATAAGASIDDRDASQIAAGYAYNLSKRTALYGQAARIMNKGSNAGFSISGGPALLAGADRKSTAFEVGIRHLF